MNCLWYDSHSYNSAPGRRVRRFLPSSGLPIQRYCCYCCYYWMLMAACSTEQLLYAFTDGSRLTARTRDCHLFAYNRRVKYEVMLNFTSCSSIVETPHGRPLSVIANPRSKARESRELTCLKHVVCNARNTGSPQDRSVSVCKNECVRRLLLAPVA